MIVFSGFDGMSCGQIALQRAGIEVDNYFASELDKYAIKVTQANYPETIQIGDVCDVNPHVLGKVNLVMGGPPCQGLSYAGKRLAFNDPRSALFFHHVRILNKVKEVNPDVKFLLENVGMEPKHRDVITHLLGVQPILVNSALVSAQNRERYYWCNWDVNQPYDRNIFLKDVLVDCSNKVGRMVGRRIDPITGKRCDYNKSIKAVQRIEPRLDHKSGTLTTVQKDNLVLLDYDVLSVNSIKRVSGITENSEGFRPHRSCGGGISELGRLYKTSAKKSSSLLASKVLNLALNKDIKDLQYRHLLPIECERLQTVPDSYTNHVSNTQRYKMLGNGWTVDVIAHILRSMPTC